MVTVTVEKNRFKNIFWVTVVGWFLLWFFLYLVYAWIEQEIPYRDVLSLLNNISLVLSYVTSKIGDKIIYTQDFDSETFKHFFKDLK